MIIRCISDIHGNLISVPKCDILIIAGDICPDYDLVKVSKWLDTDFRKWLEEIPVTNIIAVAGNHDLIFEKNPSLVPFNLRWNYLQNQSIEIDSYRIYGTPYILPIWGAFQLREKDLIERFNRIPEDIDILISHGPPYGFGDLAQPLIPKDEEKWPELEHCGSQALINRIYQINPKLVVWGHIHEGFGIHEISSRTYGINASILSSQYQVKNNPVEVVFENKRIKSISY